MRDSEGVTRASTSTSLGEMCMDSGKPSSWVLAHPWIQQVYNAESPDLPYATLKRVPDARPEIRGLHCRLLLPPIPSFTLSLETREL